jgi:hypothetical protein
LTALHQPVLGAHPADHRLQPHTGALGDVGERDLVQRPLRVELDRRLEDALGVGLRGRGAAALAGTSRYGEVVESVNVSVLA